ncbi:MAG: hypothetical protein KC613_19250, partial [Myxococcales bacterium]|nr:hypothetical protein [Myxococcales bacterium]
MSLRRWTCGALLLWAAGCDDGGGEGPADLGGRLDGAITDMRGAPTDQGGADQGEVDQGHADGGAADAGPPDMTVPDM